MRPAVLLSTSAIALLGLVTGTAQAREGQSAPTRPNVVVIMTDDQDFRSMGVMRKTQPDRTTGTTFATASVSFPLCCPSRATYYTGQYTHNHGVIWNFFPEGATTGSTGARRCRSGCRRARLRTRST